MANTTVKPARAPKTTRAPKPSPVKEPEVLETPETVEPEVLEPVSEVIPEPESNGESATPEPESVPETQTTRTTIYLKKKGEKYNVYRGSKKLTRILVSLDKAKLIACGYGESNPTII